MAMKICKECGTEMSKSAKTCPKCGKEQRNFFLQHKVLTFILVIIMLGIIIGATGGSSTNTSNPTSTTGVIGQSEDKQEDIKYTAITVDKLEDALEDNAASAKEKYNGKYLEITGKLGTIDSDLKYISLLSITDSWDFTGIHCSIKNDEQREKIKKMKKGDTIIIKGKITDVGEVLGYYLDINDISKKK